MSNDATSTISQHLSTDPQYLNLLDSDGSAVEISAGQLLQQARESAGVHVAALAVLLKVPVKKLEALEADQFELLPDAVFVRALASSVCRTLKIDAIPVLQRLPKNISPKPTYPGMSINTPFRAPSDGPGPSIWIHLSRPAVLAGLILLLAALTLIVWPSIKARMPGVQTVLGSGSSTNESATLAASVASGEANADLVKPEQVRDMKIPVTTTSSAVLPEIESKSLLPSIIAVSEPLIPPVTGSNVSINISATGSTSAALLLPTNPIVVFSATRSSWVEVTDSKGQVILRRTLNAGETVNASGVLPLAAVIGRADAIEVKIRGKAFDLSAFAKDNVARFEVK